jgi:hypothetical protein
MFAAMIVADAIVKKVCVTVKSLNSAGGGHPSLLAS